MNKLQHFCIGPPENTAMTLAPECGELHFPKKPQEQSGSDKIRQKQPRTRQTRFHRRSGRPRQSHFPGKRGIPAKMTNTAPGRRMNLPPAGQNSSPVPPSKKESARDVPFLCGQVVKVHRFLFTNKFGSYIILWLKHHNEWRIYHGLD